MSTKAVKIHTTAYNYNPQNMFGQNPRHSLSNVPIQPPLGSSDLHYQYAKHEVGFFTDWRKNPRIGFIRDLIRSKISCLHYEGVQQVSDIATTMEHQLFVVAASEDEYMNQGTLIQRMLTQVRKLHGTEYNQQVNSSNTSTSLEVDSSGLLADAALQMFASRIINLSDDCMVTTKNTNKYEFPKGGLSHPFIVDERAFSADEGSSITICTDSDGFFNFSTSGGTSNLETSTKSISSQLQHQHVDHGYIDPRLEAMMDYGNYEDILPPAKRLKIEPTFGVTVMNNEISDLWDSKIVRPYSTEGLPELQQQPESPFSIYSEATDNNMELFAKAQQDFARVGKIAKNVIDGAVEHTFESKTISKDIEASHTLEASYPTSKAMIAINIKEDISISNSSIHSLQDDPSANIEDVQGISGFNHTGKDTIKEVLEPKADLEQATRSSNPIISGVSYGAFEHTIKNETISQGSEAGDDSRENVSRSNSNIHTLLKDPSVDVEVHNRSGFDEIGENIAEKIFEPKSDLENGKKSSIPIISGISLIEAFTYSQIREHITSLRLDFGQSTNKGEKGTDVNSCTLCGMDKLSYAPLPIYCFSCGNQIKKNANYYCRKAEEFDTQHCFCTSCYKNYRGKSIKVNGLTISKATLDCKRNNDVMEEPWAQCDKCHMWQHQICALFNDKRNLECEVQYICPECYLKEIENGMHIPLPETAIFGAKDLPRTKLSDHIEQRLFSRLEQERVDKAKAEGKNVNEILGAENLTVRVVLSVKKQLKVQKQFLDILSEENYPAEFIYWSKVILLFQKIEGVDVCIYGMYVQEFGSECGYPNQRCLYISYLDSVKYFRPQRETATGEALRTFVYHEILIAYLEFCKNQGFATCYIWASPPLKGDDYILYCHPQNQKTPTGKNLRHWYQSMLRKAAEENIVVGITNMYDHFFVPAGKCDSKVTAASLPYFDGDYWSGAAMDLIRNIGQEIEGKCERKVREVFTKTTLKAMGHTNPSGSTNKDILVMQKLGQTILPFKDDFILVQLQYVCTHCHEVILSGKRWFCCECKKYQQCERCHATNTHTSISGKKHKLCQMTVIVDDIPFDVKKNDIILENDLFGNRQNFLNFCQQNQFQFDTLRRAKHSSMMILYHLKSTLLIVGTTCSFCCKANVSQLSRRCETCPQFSICSVCYKEKGPNCHGHKLRQCSSNADCQSGDQGLKQKTDLTHKLLEVLQHASRCHSTKSQPCSYPNCLQIKKLFSHANRCTVRASGGCHHCKKAWFVLRLHSRKCRDAECHIPRCMDLKKQAEWLVQQSKSQRKDAIVESMK